MPLDKRKSVSSNVSEIIRSYKRKGTIGNTKPKSKSDAIKQAVAIAHSVKRRKKVNKK